MRIEVYNCDWCEEEFRNTAKGNLVRQIKIASNEYDPKTGRFSII